MTLTWLIALTADVNLHCLVKVVPAGFLHCKAFILSFVVNKYLGVGGCGSLKAMQIRFLLKFSPSNFIIHWWISSARIISTGFA